MLADDDRLVRYTVLEAVVSWAGEALEDDRTMMVLRHVGGRAGVTLVAGGVSAIAG